MPNLSGAGTYKGYQSPDTSGWPGPIRETIKKTYGAWRSKHPGESKAIKTRGSRIAWSSARRKYPALYRAHQKERIAFQKDVRQGMKEHPWSHRTIATKITIDHWKKDHREIPIRSFRQGPKIIKSEKKGPARKNPHKKPERLIDVSGDRINSVTGVHS